MSDMMKFDPELYVKQNYDNAGWIAAQYILLPGFGHYCGLKVACISYVSLATIVDYDPVLQNGPLAIGSERIKQQGY